MKKTLIYTLGCKLNQAESSSITDRLVSEGKIALSKTGEDTADLLFVNTCAVTAKAAAKSRHQIAKLIRENPNATVIAAGCLAELDPESLSNIAGVDHVIGTAKRFERQWWDKLEWGESETLVEPVSTQNNLKRSRPFLKIQDGCEQNCTYCIIPRLRGDHKSETVVNLVSQAESMVRGGASEIVLTGVRIGAWGQDVDSNDDLVSLLSELTKVKGLFRIRLGSLEPWELNTELIKLLTTESKICNHLHIPLQHTQAEILERMGRPKLGDTLERLNILRSSHTDIALGIDIIAGFPGELDHHFEGLITDLEVLNFTYIHAFAFSPREGTPATEFSGQVPEDVKKDRVKQLRQLGDRKRQTFWQSQIGTRHYLIPDRRKNINFLSTGVTGNYLKPLIIDQDLAAGTPVKVKIYDIKAEKLIAKRV